MAYPSVDDLANYVKFVGQMTSDDECFYQACLDAAIEAVERRGNQEFGLTASQDRLFVIEADGYTIVTDNIGDSSITVTVAGSPVTATPYPLNANAKGKAYTWLVLDAQVTTVAVATVTTRYGFPTTPAGAYQAVLLQAARLSQRPDTIAGVVTWAGETGGAIRLARLDPDVVALVPVRSSYIR